MSFLFFVWVLVPSSSQLHYWQMKLSLGIPGALASSASLMPPERGNRSMSPSQVELTSHPLAGPLRSRLRCPNHPGRSLSY